MNYKKRSKLFLLLKFFIFNILAAFSVQAFAEYYLTYSYPEPSDLCTYCDSSHPKFKTYRHHKHHKRLSHRHYRKETGLFIYYTVVAPCPCTDVFTSNYCQCCPSPNRVRTEYGDYVVFSSRPADRRHGIHEQEGATFDPDMTTSDDGRADLEIN